MFDLRKFSPANFDWVLFTGVMLLTAIGFAAIYSVDLSRGTELALFKKQAVSFCLGLALFFLASILQRGFYRAYAKWAYWLAIISLVAVLFFGRNIRGTTGWFVFENFSLQPVEFAKVALILMLSFIIAYFGRRFDRPLFFFGTGVVAALPVVLVLLQPDLGSAMLLGVIWLGLVLLVGTRRAYIVSLLLVLIGAAALGWFFVFKDFQKERVLNFIDPARDPLKSGYNVSQSIIAIGSGKILGRGLGFGSQSQLRFLPEAQTDFVFSVIGEELGFAGAITVVALFMVIIWRLLLIARGANDDFVSTFVLAAAILLFSQFFVNIGANLGILPVTGVTLPFVSYGGSSLVACFLLIGIAESMAGNKY